MKLFRSHLIRCISLLIPLLLMMPGFADDSVLAIENARVRAMPPGSPATAAYMEITNTSNGTVTLTGADSSISESAEFHETTTENGVMKMREIDELVLEPGQSVSFRPGGNHLMLIGLESSPAPGDPVELSLEIDGHAPVNVSAVTSDTP